MNGYKIVLLKAIFMLYRLPECERVCSGICSQDGDYLFYANMPMLAHRSLGVKVIGDIDIWQNEWTDDTYQYFTVDKMKFAKVRDENGKLVADKTRIITTVISPSRTFRSKPTITSSMVSPQSTG